MNPGIKEHYESEKAFIIKTILLLGISTLFFFLSWNNQNTSPAIFLAFIPVFHLIDIIRSRQNESLIIFILSFVSVFFWIYKTLNWIHPLSSVAHFILSFLETLVLYLPYMVAYVHRLKRQGRLIYSLLLFIAVWIGIELFHDVGVFEFPYLNLGHVLAGTPILIQWYEFSGSIGGTIWILLVNMILYLIIKEAFFTGKRNDSLIPGISVTIAILVIPVFISFILYGNRKKIEFTEINVHAVHTSANVFDYKYKVDPADLLKEYIELTKTDLDTSGINLILWPENALTGRIFTEGIDTSQLLKIIHRELIGTNNNYLITGAILEEKVNESVFKSDPIRVMEDNEGDFYFKRYNAALFIEKDGKTLIKTKKKLIPITEKRLNIKILNPLFQLIPNLADLNFSSGIDSLNVFCDRDSIFSTLPVICYGSAYSYFIADAVKESNPGFLSLIMNEGWMKNPKPIYHFNLFAIARSIENRKFIAKSSNEGISALIDPYGRVIASKQGPDAAVVSGKLVLGSKISFYSRYHTEIVFSLFALIFLTIFFSFIRKNKTV